MHSFHGIYIHPRQFGEPQPVTILVNEKEIKIGWLNAAGEPQTETWPVKQVTVTYEPGGPTTKLALAGSDKVLSIPGEEAHKALLHIQAENAVPRVKKIWSRGKKQLAAAVIMLALLAGTYFLLAPWLSELMAKKLPRSYEISLGNQVYKSIMTAYSEDKEKTTLANTFFKQLNITTKYPVWITVVNSEQVNAFALPGGHIVIYTGILEKLKTYPELAALMAHEFTHVEKRHATRSIFRSIGTSAFLSLLFGNNAALTSMVLNNAEQLTSLKYSRSLEKEADLEGLRLLKERKIDGRGFVELMKHLGEEGKSFLPEIVASHPNIEKRIAYIQQHKDFVPVTAPADTLLHNLFVHLTR